MNYGEIVNKCRVLLADLSVGSISSKSGIEGIDCQELCHLCVRTEHVDIQLT